MYKLDLGTYNTRATEKVAEALIVLSLPKAVRFIIPRRFLDRLSLNISKLVYRLAYEGAFDDLEKPLVVEQQRKCH